ncbi:MAG: Hsp20 family protein [Planctomycetes bacterium]|nr:Hsp20 family protein [Planctomycetota bacterium]
MYPVLRRKGNGRLAWADPFEPIQREFDSMLGRFFGDADTQTSLVGAYPVDIHEDENHIYVSAELPGFKKDEVDVTLEAGVLTIRGERKSEETKGTEHLSERRFTRVQRAFTMPTSVDEAKVDAHLVDGVLKITLDKREEVKPRKIEVK